MSEQDNKALSHVYHEHQQRELCAMHAINNLFQDNLACTQKDLDIVCEQLAPGQKFWNPHRSFLGTGNYDVNVIMLVLEKKGYDVIWFDKRKNVDEIEADKQFGFVLNIPSVNKLNSLLPAGLRRRHWISIREINGDYLNLDSKLKEPQVIGNAASLLAFFKELQHQSDIEILIIAKKPSC